MRSQGWPSNLLKEGKDANHLFIYEFNAQNTVEQEEYFDFDGIMIVDDVTD